MFSASENPAISTRDTEILERLLSYETPLRAAWCAGFIDAEGHVGFMGRPQARRPVIEVAQVGCRASLELLKGTLGGHVRPRNARVDLWRIEGRGVIEAVEFIEDQLTVKRQEAVVARDFAQMMRVRGGTGRPLGLTDAEREARAATEVRMRVVKANGPDEDPRTLRPLSEAPPADIAWAAGFIDGEGFLGTGGRGATPLLEVSQRATPAPLLRLQALFGGSINLSGRSPRWVWKVNSAPRMRLVLGLLVPHLIVKAEQAEALLAYASTFNARGANATEEVARALRSQLAERLAAARKGRRQWLPSIA